MTIGPLVQFAPTALYHPAAACFCNSTYAHGRVPADPRALPGTPPLRRGRPLGHLCRRSPWGNVAPEQLYGEDGWCQVWSAELHVVLGGQLFYQEPEQFAGGFGFRAANPHVLHGPKHFERL